MANLDLARGRSTVLNLTNQTGVTRSPGDVVVLSTGSDESFTTANSSNYSLTQIGVVDETIGIGSNGRVVVEGYARTVNVGVNTVSRGNWLYQSTTLGVGVGSAINPPLAGAFGQVLKGGTGTAPSAVIMPTLQSSGGGSSVSAGSNSMAVGATNQAGVAATFSPSDHRHMGLHSITSSSSNALQRPTVNFRAGTNVGLTATDTDGDGTLDTITIHSSAAGGGGGGGVTQSYLGYNTVGGTQETATNQRLYAKLITPGANGVLQSIEVYTREIADGIADLAVALYEDNAGALGKILALSRSMTMALTNNATFGDGSTTSIARWLGVPITYALTSGTSYWISWFFFSSTNSPRIFYDGSGSDRRYDSGGNFLVDGGRYSETTDSRKYSVRALVIS